MTEAIRVPAGARWSCSNCAQCCAGHDIGPVEPEVITRLEEAGISQLWEPAAEQPWYAERPGPTGPQAFLTMPGGRCIFLRDDDLCAIHATLGESFKPGTCRVFPFLLTEDAGGISMIARSACGGLHHTFETGADLATYADDVLAIEGGRPRRRVPTDAVALVGGARVDAPRWAQWSQELEQHLHSRPGGPEVLIGAARSWLFGRLDAAPPEPSAHRARMASGATLEALIRTMARVAQQSTAGVAADRVAFVEDMTGRLSRAQKRLGTPAPLDPTAERYLNLLLRSQIVSNQLATFGDVASGLGAFVLGTQIARTTATDTDPDAPLDAAAVASVLTPWVRFAAIPGVHRILTLARPALVDVFLHLPEDP